MVQAHYVDALGRTHRVPAGSLRAIRAVLAKRPAAHFREKWGQSPFFAKKGDDLGGPSEVTLENGRSLTLEDGVVGSNVPDGYHRVRRLGDKHSRLLVVAPRTCYLPRELRVWGWAIQLYAARSRRSWGIGDLADLRWLGRWARAQGAGIALVNPLSAPTPILPQQPSPYFPTSRRFRNPLFLCIEDIDGARDLDGVEELARRARQLNAVRQINRDAVFALKFQALERIWNRVRQHPDAAFDEYCREQGCALTGFAAYCVLAERYGTGWHGWPSRYRRPRSTAVARIGTDGATRDRARFHCWVQFQLDRQLARASRAVPVMQDLPIGFDADGADAWAFQDVLADGVSVGAPPDEFNAMGQNWGLPPFVPEALRAAEYAPFIETIRACLRHAGGLRIDHVMGLMRLFWIPAGRDPAAGAYVLNHAEELLDIVALESQRARAVIVGEDLGTVDGTFRRHLMERSVLSYRLLWFEKERPETYPRQALAAVTTHDLPTVAGLWTGADEAAQRRAGLAVNEAGTHEIVNRVRRWTRASARASVDQVIGAVYRLLAHTPSHIVTATLDDAMGVKERPNMPASGNGWPNWSLALPQPIEALETLPLARRIGRALASR